MAANRMVNRRDYRDGKIILYQLEGVPTNYGSTGSSDPGTKGYKTGGTRTSDEYEARRQLIRSFDELDLAAKLGKPPAGRKLKAVVEEFDKAYSISAPSAANHKAIMQFLNGYLLPHFSRRSITELTPAELTKFFDWRRLNGKRGKPKNTTILHEMSRLQTFLRWCRERDFIAEDVKIKRPKLVRTRRPHFEQADWQRLTRHLREWPKLAEGTSGPIVRNRTLLCNYILILANSGLRPGEAKNLQWNDIEVNRGQMMFNVSGKTGRRAVAVQSTVKEYIGRIKNLRKQECNGEPPLDSYVFCHKNGNPVKSFKKGFSALIKSAGVELNSHNEKRTIYSLRHTYATFRLEDNANIFGLALNMGTSVKMIEKFYGHATTRAMASEITKSRINSTSTRKAKTNKKNKKPT